MVSKGSGWHGESKRHQEVAIAKSLQDTLRVPMSLKKAELSDNEIYAFLRTQASIPVDKSWIEHGIHSSGGYGHLPITYLRFGRPPQGNKPSHNYFTDQPERGVSVIATWYDKKTKKYVVTGEGELQTLENLMDLHKLYHVTGTLTPFTGGDGEPLLDPLTVKIVKEVSLKDIVDQSEPSLPFGGGELDESETPDWENSPDLLWGSLNMIRQQLKDRMRY